MASTEKKECSHSLGEPQGVKHQTLAPESRGARQRKDLREPDPCLCPQNKGRFPNLRVSGFLSSAAMLPFFFLPICPLWQTPLHILAPHSPPQSRALRVTRDAASRAEVLRFVHQIKHLSTFRVCMFCNTCIVGTHLSIIAALFVTKVE